MDNNSGRPLLITLLFIFMFFIALPLFVLGLFNDKVLPVAQTVYGDFFIPSIVISIIGFVGVFGLFLMKKWGFYLFLFTAVFGSFLDLAAGRPFKPVTLIVSLIFVTILFKYYKRLA